MAGAVLYKHAARWQVAFQVLSCHCMDGLQTWCNNNLGVVYLATAAGLPQVMDDCPF